MVEGKLPWRYRSQYQDLKDHLCRACVAAERFEGGLRFALHRDSKVMQSKHARKVRRGDCLC
jgi:hypothetical protein